MATFQYLTLANGAAVYRPDPPLDILGDHAQCAFAHSRIYSIATRISEGLTPTMYANINASGLVFVVGKLL
jgi:hypothetical protein